MAGPEDLGGGPDAGPVLLEFSDFYRSWFRDLARALGLTLGDLALGAEAAEEAMGRVHARWERLRDHPFPPGWAFRTGLRWIDSPGHRWRRRFTEPRFRSTTRPESSDPDVHRALRGLALDQRTVLVGRYLLDWSDEEVAIAAGTRPEAVARTLTAATERLEGALGPGSESVPDRLIGFAAEQRAMIQPFGDGPDRAMDRGHRIRGGRRVAVGVAAVALVLLGGGAALAMRAALAPGSGTEPVDTTIAPGLTIADLTWDVYDSTVGYATDISGGSTGFAALSTAPDASWLPGVARLPEAVYLSTDGRDWVIGLLEDDLWGGDFTHYDGALYKLTTAPATTGAVAAQMAVSTDEGLTWDRIPLTLEATPTGGGAEFTSVITTVTAGPAGVLALVETRFEPGLGTFSELFRSEDGVTFEAVPSPFRATGGFVALEAVGSGFLAREFDFNPRWLWSADGTEWVELGAPEIDGIVAAGTYDGSVVVVGTQLGNAVVLVGDPPETPFTRVRLDRYVADATGITGESWVASADVGPLGIVVAVQAWSNDGRQEAVLVHGTAADEWTVLRIDELAPVGPVSWIDGVAVGNNAILVRTIVGGETGPGTSLQLVGRAG